ncbi:hypothetical protein [Burkholderia cepacia]|uniref:hypothetical protein n=1 Tax=Burkholderia cepacia TaxID=292 RepID=UPI0026E10957|nr:hypothetical protein [Burkholderia cepacia]MDO5940620.1 hypothetical protein [Burkholderia cepacia]
MERGKQEFSGAVGDVAGRDVVNHAAPITNSNVVNVQFGQKEAVIELVTDHQKAVMMELIDQIAAATKSHRLKICRVVLARAGAKRIKEIRRDAYVDIEQYLTTWMKRVSPTPKPTAKPPTAETSPQAVLGYENRIRELTAQLDVVRTSAASLRRNLHVAVFTLVVVLVCGSVLGYMAWAGQSHSCMYAGATYAVGSVIDNANAADIECVAGVAGASPEWRQIKAGGKR